MSDLSFGLVGGEEGDGGLVVAAGWLPAVKLTGRIHGGMVHMKMMTDVTRRYLRRGIPKTDIRNNQQLVDASGASISRFRPDVQIIDRAAGHVTLFEVTVSSKLDQERVDKMMAITRVAFTGWRVFHREVKP